MTRRSLSLLPLLVALSYGQETVQNHNGMFVTANYRSVLNRMPDPGSWIFYRNSLDGGGSRAGLTDFFLGSGEYASKFGAPDNPTFVSLLYQNALRRTPSAAEIAGRVPFLEAGQPRWQMTHEFIYSPEFSLNAQNVADLAYRTDWSDPVCATLDASRLCTAAPPGPLAVSVGTSVQLTVKYHNKYGQADFGQGQVIVSKLKNVLEARTPATSALTRMGDSISAASRRRSRRSRMSRRGSPTSGVRWDRWRR